MEDEKKAEQEAENPEADKTVNEEKKTPEKIEPKEEAIDYKAELDKAKSIIAHKEQVIKNYQSKKDDDDEPEVDGLEEIRKKQEEEFAKIKFSLLEDTIDDEIKSLAKSDDEAELIRFHVKNSVKMGNSKSEVRDAVKTAWLKANEKKILSTNRELAEALTAKSTTKSYAESGGQRVKEEDKPKFTKEEKNFLSKYGVK